MPSPPDFVGVGAEGAASAWWHGALIAHPGIGGPREPLRFFEPFCERELQESDIAAYHRHFGDDGGGISGEWTNSYMADGWVPPLLRRVAPDAKLLVLLRDPIEHYRAVLAQRKAAQPPGKRVVMTDVVDRASYAFQLARLGRYFPRDRILVLQQERCRSEPVEQYIRTLRFLGVADAELPRGVKRALSQTGEPRLRLFRRLKEPPEIPLWPELEGALHAALDPGVAELRAAAPELDLRLWPNFAHLADAPAPVPA